MDRINALWLVCLIVLLSACSGSGYSGVVAEAGPINVALTLDTRGNVVLSGGVTVPLFGVEDWGIGWTAGFNAVLREARESQYTLFVVWEDERGVVKVQRYDIARPFSVSFSSQEWVRKIEHTGDGTIVVAVEILGPETVAQSPQRQQPQATVQPTPRLRPTATVQPTPRLRPTATVPPPTRQKPEAAKDVPSCSTSVHAVFRQVAGVKWDLLGCPSAPARTGVWMAKEGFEGGQMIWREDLGEIYVRYSSGRWAAYRDTWAEGQPEFACPDFGTQSPPVPKRGFGKVWCNDSSVRSGLGKARNEEQGFYGDCQDFQGGGHALRMDTGKVIVLYPNGTWVEK